MILEKQFIERYRQEKDMYMEWGTYVCNYIVKKIVNLRIFDDENGIMNKSLLDVGGDILSISQFTLYADSRKGRRPSYVNALNGAEAIKLYDIFNEKTWW